MAAVLPVVFHISDGSVQIHDGSCLIESTTGRLRRRSWFLAPWGVPLWRELR